MFVNTLCQFSFKSSTCISGLEKPPANVSANNFNSSFLHRIKTVLYRIRYLLSEIVWCLIMSSYYSKWLPDIYPKTRIYPIGNEASYPSIGLHCGLLCPTKCYELLKVILFSLSNIKKWTAYNWANFLDILVPGVVFLLV